MGGILHPPGPMSTVLEYVEVGTGDRRFCPRGECSGKGCAGRDPNRKGPAQYAREGFFGERKGAHWRP